LGYLKATIEFALKHPELKDEFESYLKNRWSLNDVLGFIESMYELNRYIF
jgi:hypothetical protein